MTKRTQSGQREPEDGRTAVEDLTTQRQIEGLEPYQRKQVKRP